jgi:CRP-like cAMP-binding protein
VSAGSIADELKRLALFDGVSREELVDLVPTMDQVDFREGQWIVRENEESSSFYVIIEGEVGVVIDDQEIAILPKGSFFGEVSALLDEPTTANLVARSGVRCLVLPAARLEDFLIEHPRVMFHVLKTEARRLRTAGRPR